MSEIERKPTATEPIAFRGYSGFNVRCKFQEHFK